MPTDERSFDNLTGTYMQDEFKLLNAHLPRKRRYLAELLTEENPLVLCNDGGAHHFRKRELSLLAQWLTPEERKILLLPVLLEVISGEDGVTVRSKHGLEAKIFSQILNMTILCKENKIVIFKPQLHVIRKILKTATQYVFSSLSH